MKCEETQSTYLPTFAEMASAMLSLEKVKKEGIIVNLKVHETEDAYVMTFKDGSKMLVIENMPYVL